MNAKSPRILCDLLVTPSPHPPTPALTKGGLFSNWSPSCSPLHEVLVLCWDRLTPVWRLTAGQLAVSCTLVNQTQDLCSAAGWSKRISFLLCWHSSRISGYVALAQNMVKPNDVSKMDYCLLSLTFPGIGVRAEFPLYWHWKLARNHQNASNSCFWIMKTFFSSFILFKVFYIF